MANVQQYQDWANSSATDRISYPGNNSVGPFVVPFAFLRDEFLYITIAKPGRDDQILQLNYDYTASGAGERRGGSITLTQPLLVGTTLWIIRTTDIDQSTHYRPESPFPAQSHQYDQDKKTHVLQELASDTARYLKVPLLDRNIRSTTIDDLMPLRVIRVDASGQGFEAVEASLAGLDQSSNAINYVVTQVNHGKTLGQFLTITGPNTYGLASSLSGAQAETCGVVAKVISPDRYVIANSGLVYNAFTNLTPGQVYFLSTIPGAITLVENTTAQQISKPVLYALSATSGFLLNYRGKYNPDSGSQAGGGGSGAASGLSLIQTFTQPAHGFAVGQVLRYDTTSQSFQLACADSVANAETLGLIQAITTDTFDLVFSGLVNNLTLPALGTLFLDPVTPGALTTTEPSVLGQVSKPVLEAISLTSGVFVNWRGALIQEAPDSSITANAVATSGSSTPSPGQTMVSSTNVGGMNIYNLPTDFKFGQSFIVLGYTGGAGWKVTQGTGQQIFQGDAESTIGPTGYVSTFESPRDNAILACVDNQSLIFTVVTSSGNLSFV